MCVSGGGCDVPSAVSALPHPDMHRERDRVDRGACAGAALVSYAATLLRRVVCLYVLGIPLPLSIRWLILIVAFALFTPAARSCTTRGPPSTEL